MKIAIIGAGFTGLSAAYRLRQKGYEVTIFEKAGQPGGLALGFQEKGWEWTLEEYYHHLFTIDEAILGLAKEIGYPIITKRPKTSVYLDGVIYPLDSPLKLLQFSKLSFFERLRMGIVLAFLRYNPYWQPLEKFAAAKFLKQTMGEHAYQAIWEPQLVNKFGKYIDTISLAWFWARIKVRTPSLAYPEKGFLIFSQTLAENIKELGGEIQYNFTIEKIEKKHGKFSVGKGFTNFDKLIVTLPSFAFVKLFPNLPQNYKQKLAPLKGLGAVVMILRLKEKFLPDDTYWLSVCEKSSPVLAVVEHTNFMDKRHYNNEHLVYLGNYLPPDHPYFSMDKQKLLKVFDPFLQKIHPEYEKNLIGTELFKLPFAQPIIPVNYSKMIPPFETPIKNVYLANMQQVYPWDRGTNYAVELGDKIAKML